MYAVYNNKPNVIPHLLGELGMQNEDGRTALHWACWYNYVECAE